MKEYPPRTVPIDQRLRVNNFDLPPFIFAFTVLLVHSYVLSGAESLVILTSVFSSEMAREIVLCCQRFSDLHEL